jgi:hypothetical protein
MGYAAGKEVVMAGRARSWVPPAGVVLALALAGCGKKTPEAPAATPVKMENPRATADTLVAAYQQRNPELAVALLPPESLLRSSFDCPEDQLVKRVAKDKETAPGVFAKARPREIAAFDKSGTEHQQLRVGDEWRGCKAKAVIDVHNSKMDLRITEDGKTEFESETWTFLKFSEDPNWYYIR